MAAGRLEILKGMLEQDPRNSFARYGLAMEYKNSGDLEAAEREFRTLLEADPSYAAGYFHAGQTLERLGKLDDARAMYVEGIEVTSRKGDLHARDELRGALELLG
jgi:Tfp pilus assembly protein PilF